MTAIAATSKQGFGEAPNKAPENQGDSGSAASAGASPPKKAPRCLEAKERIQRSPTPGIAVISVSAASPPDEDQCDRAGGVPNEEAHRHSDDHGAGGDEADPAA